MNNFFKSSFPSMAVFSVIALIVHFLIIQFTELGSLIGFKWIFIHVFLMPITFLEFLFISNNVKKTGNINSIGKTYLMFTVFKMLASLGFLSPWLIQKGEVAIQFCMHFFAVFFPFLLVETILLVRFLNRSFDEKKENDENQG